MTLTKIYPVLYMKPSEVAPAVVAVPFWANSTPLHQSMSFRNALEFGMFKENVKFLPRICL